MLEKKSYPTQDRNSSSACVLESKGPKQTSNLHSSLGRGTRKEVQDPQSVFRVLTGVSSLNRGKTSGGQWYAAASSPQFKRDLVDHSIRSGSVKGIHSCCLLCESLLLKRTVQFPYRGDLCLKVSSSKVRMLQRPGVPRS